MTNPAAVTMSIGLLADAQLSWFLQSHQDNYIVTRKLPYVYRDYYVIGFYRDGTASHRLSGLAKNSLTLTQTATN